MLKEHELLDLKGIATGYKQIYNESGDYMSTTTLAYKPIEHEHVENMVKESLKDLGIDYDLKRMFPHNGRDCFLKFTFNGFNELVKPQNVVFNSYKSGTALENLCGAFTTACANGSIIGTRFSDLNHRHIKDLNEPLFKNRIADFVKSYPEHLNFLEKLKTQTPNQLQVETILKEITLAERNQKEIYSLFTNRTETAPTNRRDNSLHSLYQSATEFFTHKSKSGEANKLNSLENVGNIFYKLVA